MFLEFSSVKRVENWIASLSCYERKKKRGNHLSPLHHRESGNESINTNKKKKKKRLFKIAVAKWSE